MRGDVLCSRKQNNREDHFPSNTLTPSHTARQTGDDDGDRGLESIALSLLDALSPSPQMLEIGAQLTPISVFNSERRQDGRHGLEHHGVDIFVMKSLLFRQCLGNHRPDIMSRVSFIP